MGKSLNYETVKEERFSVGKHYETVKEERFSVGKHMPFLQERIRQPRAHVDSLSTKLGIMDYHPIGERFPIGFSLTW